MRNLKVRLCLSLALALLPIAGTVRHIRAVKAHRAPEVSPTKFAGPPGTPPSLCPPCKG